MNRIAIFSLCVIAVLIQHIIHEYAHVAAIKICGEKVKKIQWFTYYGGTRIFLENEPPENEKIGKKWGIIASAGYVATNVIGYFWVLLFYIIQNIPLKRWCCIAAIMFLLCDSLYFVLGSIGNFGDIIGIRRNRHMSEGISVFLSVFIMLINILVIKSAFY